MVFFLFTFFTNSFVIVMNLFYGMTLNLEFASLTFLARIREVVYPSTPTAEKM